MLQCHHCESLDLGKVRLRNNWPYRRTGNHLICSFVWHPSWTAAWDVKISANANSMPHCTSGPGYRSHDRKPESAVSTVIHFLETRCGHGPLTSILPRQFPMVSPEELKSPPKDQRKRGSSVAVLTPWRRGAVFESLTWGADSENQSWNVIPSYFLWEISQMDWLSPRIKWHFCCCS